jgi:protein-S-isoprenylcysteine O-methyltransferase Ste14
MAGTDVDKQTLRAWALVGVQGVLFAMVVIAALAPALGPALWAPLPLALALIVAGSIGVIASARDLGSALTPLPIPNGKGMAAKGLYHWARHPMYSSLVVICLGVAVGAGKVQTYVVVVLLAAFFMLKARTEERYLLTAYEGYPHYAAVTGRFVPGIGRLKTLDRGA